MVWEKRAAAVFMLCVFLIGLTGCSKAKQEASDGKLQVVATVFAEYDFLKNIAGDAIDLDMLLLPGADAHSYDPTPKDIVAVQDADLFVTIGGESDAWAETILDSVDGDLETVRLMDCIDTVLAEETVEGMETEEESDEDDGEEMDEHVWTSPKNAIQIVEKLCDTLCSLDAENAALYKKNAAAYEKKLKKLDEQFTEVVQNAKRKEIIVADRFPFRYFAAAYGLKYYAAFPGCSTQTGASAETIAFLIQKVRKDEIPVVFHMELSDESMADTICDETGAKKAQLNAVHNISRTDFEKGIGYVELMQENVSVLREALNEAHT